MTPADWARGVVAAHEQKNPGAGATGRGKTSTTDKEEPIVHTVQLPTDVQANWATDVDYRPGANGPEIVHEAALINRSDVGDSDGLYIEAMRVTTVLADRVEVAKPTIGIDGMISTGMRRLSLAEAEMLAWSLLNVVLKVDGTRGAPVTPVDAPPAQEPTTTSVDGIDDDNTYASTGYRDRKPYVYLQVEDDSTGQIAVRLLEPDDARELAKKLKLEAKAVDEGVARGWGKAGR